jgi:pimeloyl-ACP methyl ester carboxylesterase
VKAHPAFNVIASGPPISVGQQGLYAGMSGGGQYLPGLTTAQIDDQLATATGGYDPRPVLVTDAVPTLWLFGGADRHVPASFSVVNLRRLHRPNFVWRVFPGCSHNLLFTRSGLDAADNAATHFGGGLFTTIAAFVRHEGVQPLS